MEPSVINPIYSLLSLIFWFIFFFLFLMPALRRYSLNKAREALISTLEKKRKSRRCSVPWTHNCRAYPLLPY